MKRVSANDPDDFEVEITSLDTPATSEHAHDEFLQGARLAPRVRTLLTVSSVIGGLLLIFVVLSPFLSSLLPKKASTPPPVHLPPAQIENVTVQNGITYITSSDGILRALNIKNGSLLWQRNLAGTTHFFMNDTVYIDNYSNHKSTIQALRAKDGTVRWTFQTALDITPLIIDNGVASTPFQFSPQGQILTALDGRNGAELWHHTMNMAQLQNTSIQNIQDRIYITIWPNAQNANMALFVLKMSDGSQLWHTTALNIQLTQNNLVGVTTKDGVIKVLRADNGNEIWRYKSSNGATLSPIPENNLFYIQNPQGALQALGANNGALLWTYKDPWGVGNIFPEANGVLYIETGDGFIVALRTSDGAPLWHVRPIAPPFTIGSVQVEDGIAYTFTTIGAAQNETIAALRTSDGTILWKRQIDISTNNMFFPLINGWLIADSGNTISILRAHDGTTLWNVKYTQSTSQSNSGFLAIDNNIIILRSSDSVLEAHQLETGAVLWRYPRTAAPSQTYWSVCCKSS